MHKFKIDFEISSKQAKYILLGFVVGGAYAAGVSRGKKKALKYFTKALDEDAMVYLVLKDTIKDFLK